MGLATVVHFHNVKHLWDREKQVWAEPDLLYIGRANSHHNLPASPWANPFIIGKQRTREQVIEQYALNLTVMWSSVHLKLDFETLKGKRLVCWCSPEACHGDVLAGMVNDPLVGRLFETSDGIFRVLYRHPFYGLPYSKVGGLRYHFIATHIGPRGGAWSRHEDEIRKGLLDNVQFGETT